MTVTNTSTGIGYATLSAAIAASTDGDTIDIPAGTYIEEFPLITHSLTLNGVGGMAHLMTPNPVPANGRAVLFVAGNANADLTVSNLEISGAHDAASNGAGILFEVGNHNLTIMNSWFHDNQDGVLGCQNNCNTVVITGSEFNNNGLPSSDPRYGLSHDLYLGQFNSVTITGNYFHDALGGHEIKSRAFVTDIIGNRIQDGPTADTSYSIDLPYGGAGIITGNVIEKGPAAVNRYAIHFGGEIPVGTTSSYAGSSLLVSNNLMINDRLAGGTAIFNQSVDSLGDAFAVTATGNTVWNFDGFYTAAYPALQDSFSANLLITGTAPPLDTSHPWDTPEPASAALLGMALLATTALRRRRAGQKKGNRR